MGSFSTGFCVGLGLSLLFTPKTGEEMRHLVAERIRHLRSISSEDQGLTPLVEQGRVRLQEVQTRAEPMAPIDATAPGTRPIQQTASSEGEAQQNLNGVAQQAEMTSPIVSPVQEAKSSTEGAQQDLNQTAQQMEVTPPTVSPVQEMPSSTQEVQQDLNRAAPQAEVTTPTTGAVQEVPESVKEEQWNLNQSARQASSTNPTPIADITQETEGSPEDVQQRDLNRAAKEMGATIPDTTQGTASDIEETQKDLNRITRQPGTGTPHHHKRSRR
jgi:hypothetical protein